MAEIFLVEIIAAWSRVHIDYLGNGLLGVGVTKQRVKGRQESTE